MNEHICTEEEVKLINQINCLKELITSLRSQLLVCVKEHKYIYNNDYCVVYRPESEISRINMSKLRDEFPKAYEECVNKYKRKEHINIYNRNNFNIDPENDKLDSIYIVEDN